GHVTGVQTCALPILLTGLKIFTPEELESRYHVRLERYVKDMLIELHTLREMADTLVLPAAFSYANGLVEAASRAKGTGINGAPRSEERRVGKEGREQ